jgi:hypothetical protein
MNEVAARELLLALQALQVAILALHDWVPLGRLNDVRAIRAQSKLMHLFSVTAVQTLPFVVGLIASAALWHRQPYPDWLHAWLWVSYGLLFIGEVQAWWIPYLIRPQPQRAARYQKMFGSTHAVLPARNGLTPNTMHLILHIATLATLIALFFVR